MWCEILAQQALQRSLSVLFDPNRVYAAREQLAMCRNEIFPSIPSSPFSSLAPLDFPKTSCFKTSPP